MGTEQFNKKYVSSNIMNTFKEDRFWTRVNGAWEETPRQQYRRVRGGSAAAQEKMINVAYKSSRDKTKNYGLEDLPALKVMVQKLSRISGAFQKHKGITLCWRGSF